VEFLRGRGGAVEEENAAGARRLGFILCGGWQDECHGGEEQEEEAE
jgi:hypothetical protein